MQSSYLISVFRSTRILGVDSHCLNTFTMSVVYCFEVDIVCVRNGVKDLALATDLQKTEQGTKNYDMGSNHRHQDA